MVAPDFGPVHSRKWADREARNEHRPDWTSIEPGGTSAAQGKRVARLPIRASAQRYVGYAGVKRAVPLPGRAGGVLRKGKSGATDVLKGKRQHLAESTMRDEMQGNNECFYHRPCARQAANIIAHQCPVSALCSPALPTRAARRVARRESCAASLVHPSSRAPSGLVLQRYAR